MEKNKIFCTIWNKQWREKNSREYKIETNQRIHTQWEERERKKGINRMKRIQYTHTRSPHRVIWLCVLHEATEGKRERERMVIFSLSRFFFSYSLSLALSQVRIWYRVLYVYVFFSHFSTHPCRLTTALLEQQIALLLCHIISRAPQWIKQFYVWVYTYKYVHSVCVCVPSSIYIAV